MFDQERAGSGTIATSSDSSRTGAGGTTASLPTRPSGELPQGASPEIQAALAIQLQESAATNEFERDPFGIAHVGVGAAAQHRGAAPPVANTGGPELVVPKLIEFDDLEIGERQRRETILWNVGPAEARVIRADIAIDSHQKQFQVRKVPDRIMPTSSPVAAKSGEIVIDFVPQGEGLRTDTLRLAAKSIDAHGIQRDFEIVLAGRGHRPGQPTHAEEHGRQRDDEKRDSEEKLEADRDTSRIGRTKRNQDDLRIAPTGRLATFDARLDDIRDDVRAIDAKRAEGVSIVEREAAAFVRRKPPPTPSTWNYIREGAALALTFASYGLAKGVARAIIGGGESRGGPTGMGIGVKEDGQREAKSPSRHAIERSVEKALGKGMEWVIGKTVKPSSGDSQQTDSPSGSSLSGDPSVAFFASQRVALSDSSRARLGEITSLGPELVDQLHDEKAFQDVLAVLDAVRDGLGSVAGKKASEEQSQASASQWISFVSKMSGETHKANAGASAASAGQPHAEMVSNLRPLDSRDGVIEISFAADLNEPHAPVRIVGVRVLGIAQEIAERIRTMHPLDAQIPMRAVARDLTSGGQRIADPAISIARNEVGDITVAAGKPGELAETNQQARYLAAKHAPERQHRRMDADVEAGGRRVIETEIVGQWSQVLTEPDSRTNPKLDVKTDDASKPKL